MPLLLAPSIQERSECGEQRLDIEGGRVDLREGDAAGGAGGGAAGQNQAGGQEQRAGGGAQKVSQQPALVSFLPSLWIAKEKNTQQKKNNRTQQRDNKRSSSRVRLEVEEVKNKGKDEEDVSIWTVS